MSKFAFLLCPSCGASQADEETGEVCFVEFGDVVECIACHRTFCLKVFFKDVQAEVEAAAWDAVQVEADPEIAAWDIIMDNKGDTSNG